MLFRKLSFWLALAGLTVSFLLIAELRAQLNQPVPPPPIMPAVPPFDQSIGAAGLVEAFGENTAVGVPMPGLVAAVEVAVWKTVQAGDPLLRLDDREARARLDTLRAQVRVTEASLALVADRVRRLEGVSDPRAIPQEELKLARSEAAVAEAQLAAARSAVVEQETHLARLTVRAPAAGTVLQVNTRVGEYLVPGATTPPVLLGRVDIVQVRTDVDEQLAPLVRTGARAVGRVKGRVEAPVELTFLRIEPAILPKRSLTGAPNERVDTRVLQVLFTCPNQADAPLYIGQQLDLFIEALPR